MTGTPYLRSALALGVSTMALLAAQPTLAQESKEPVTTVGELVVTTQRREEALQDVPVAVSAFNEEGLKEQRIETGADLLRAIPNVNFSRANFGGYNFQIRGIGTKLVATSADAAIGVHVNNVPLGSSTLADSNFYDVERIEVLRGPQGTQFGRNTTGGLINIITAKPEGDFSASLTGEVGNYGNRRANGYINVPIGDMFAVRAAGSWVTRDGFGENVLLNQDIDGRDLWSGRLTVAFNPTDKVDAYLMWEHFEEDDNRTQVGKQLCIKDPGRTTVGGVPTTGLGGSTQNYFSQGCAMGDLRGPAGLGTLNSAATLGGGLGVLTGLITGDAYAGKVQDPDLRNIESAFQPVYQNEFDAWILNVNIDLTDSLQLSYTGAHSESESFTKSDYNRVAPSQTFNVTPLSPGGFFNDPQVGNANRFRTFQFGVGEGEQTSHELRLQSSLDGAWNFSLGASYQSSEVTTDLYVTSNTLTAVAVGLYNLTILAPFCPPNGGPANCVLVDPNPIPTGEGGNYFDSRTDYSIESRAAFGEVNLDVTDEWRLTVGLRYTQDRKRAQPYAPALFVPGNTGVAPLAIQQVTFDEWTGRTNLEWSPDLAFTDKTLLYFSYSRGYKGGGFNPPQTPGQELFPTSYQPEFINALEFGAKNVLMDGRMVLNFTAFHYDYKGYQVSQIIQRTSVNTNIDAKIWGLELESIWEPVPHLRLNANLGYLHTELADTAALDLMDLTQGDPNFVTLKNGSTFSNCIAPTAQVAQLQALINAGVLPAIVMPGAPGAAGIGVCQGAFFSDGPGGLPNGALSGLVVVNPSAGIPDQLGGNELPNSPHWTVSLGAQYQWQLGASWTLTPRVDFYYQGESYARIYNRINDRLDSYTNTNLSLVVENEGWGLSAQLFVRNVTDETVVTDQYLTDDTSGLFTNIFLLEPRTYGISITKRF
ncbi:MAG: TonB-dependent receptor [Caulobacter sp.]|nr:TonB-dependent receptor [Caulobacter sp.]